MSKQPFISIPLDIPELRVLQTDLTAADELILTVESTLTSTSCRRCGRTLIEQHGEDRSRLLRHLPILGRPVYLRIRPKRFRCPSCDDHPTTTQDLDWYDPDALHTKAYERLLIVQLINSLRCARLLWRANDTRASQYFHQAISIAETGIDVQAYRLRCWLHIMYSHMF